MAQNESFEKIPKIHHFQLLALSLFLPSCFLLQSAGDESTDDKKFYRGPSLAYFCVYAFNFGFLLDLSIIIVLFGKHKHTYLQGHLLVASLIFVVLLINSVYFLYSSASGESNSLALGLDGFIAACLMLQALLGISIKDKMLNKERFEDFFVKKRLHRVNAFIIFLLSKSKIFYLLFEILNDFALIPLIFVLGIYLLILGGVYSFLIIKSRKEIEPKISLQKMNARAKKEDEEHLEEVIAAIESHECGRDETLDSVSSLHSLLRAEPSFSRQIGPKIKWFAFEESIYRIPKIDHAGGNFFLRQANRQDLTFLIHGKKATVVFESARQDFMLIRHRHRGTTYQFLAENKIGNYARHSIFVRRNSLEEPEPTEKTFLNVFEHNNRSFNTKGPELKTQISTGMCRMSLIITLKDSPFVLALAQISDVSSESKFVDMDVYWVKMLGKYFKLDFGETKGKKFGQGILSLSPNYLKLKREFLKSLPQGLNKAHVISRTQQIDRLLSTQDYNGSGRFSLFYPIFLKLKPARFDLPFRLSPPIGLGLGFTPFSTQKFLVLAKNEGICPFIDLIEILYNRCLGQLTELPKDSWIFGGEYRLSFANGLKLSFLWIIENSFLEWAQTLGLWQLQNLMAAEQAAGNEFPAIVKDVVIDNSSFEATEYPALRKSMTRGMNLKGILSTHWFDFDKILISGDDAFKERLFVGSNLEASILEKVRFI